MKPIILDKQTAIALAEAEIITFRTFAGFELSPIKAWAVPCLCRSASGKEFDVHHVNRNGHRSILLLETSE